MILKSRQVYATQSTPIKSAITAENGVRAHFAPLTAKNKSALKKPSAALNKSPVYSNVPEFF